MKIYFQLVLLFVVVLLQQAVFANEDSSISRVKMEMLDLGTLETGRPSKINVWFSQGQCSELTDTQFCLDDVVDTHEVVVLSHGSMGSALEYSWIAQGLAAAGFIVVGVNHYGESWIYGQEAVSSPASNLIWQRAQDVSAVLDRLATQNIFQKKVDWTNVIALGHSAGGQTVAMLAGATFDLKQMIAYCRSTQSKGDLSCNYGSGNGQIQDSFFVSFSEQQKDFRIKMLVMFDPALGAAVISESLHNIKLPTLIVGATNNDFLPWPMHGLRYASEIPNAKVNLLTGSEGHFVFIAPCDHKIKVMGISLCEDKAGVDRKAIQENLIKVVTEFIRANNTFVGNQNRLQEYHKAFVNDGGQRQSISLLDILRYTPHWVFGLLAMLITFGLLQTRKRQVRIQVALIIPVVMLLLSLTGIIQFVGWKITALALWLLGITLMTGLIVRFFNKNIAHYDSATKKLTITGSWLPLLVILGIFITRYVLGVVKSLNPDLMQQEYFQLPMSLLLGTCSGFFLARGIIFWRAKKSGLI